MLQNPKTMSIYAKSVAELSILSIRVHKKLLREN